MLKEWMLRDGPGLDEAGPVLVADHLWWERKEKIQGLRRRGLSYGEIRARLPFSVSKGTVSRWCREIELTPQQLDRLDGLKTGSWYRNRLKGSKANQQKRAKQVAEIRARARAEVPRLTRRELWAAGLMLYWAEGSKSHQVCLTNSDPNLVRFMMQWFREFCGMPEEKLRVRLHLHSGQNEHSMKRFWSGVTGIPLSQFGKSYVKKEGTGHRKNILYHGTIQVSFCDKNMLHRICGWIEGFSERTSGR